MGTSNSKRKANLCILQSNNSSKPLAKIFKANGDVVGYSFADKFMAKEVVVDNIEVLHHLLVSLASQPSKALTAGLLTGEARKKKFITRKLENFQDKNKHWICLDIEKFDLPENIDVVTQPKEAIEHFISTLPSTFHNVTYHFKLSSSCGVKSKTELRTHLYFFLKKPTKLSVFKSFFKSNISIDRSVFVASQLIYTSNPIFENESNNPISNQLRSGLIEKDFSALDIGLRASESASKKADSKPARGINPKKSLDRDSFIKSLGDGDNRQGFNTPIRTYVAYLCTYHWHEYIQARIELYKNDIRLCIEKAPTSDARGENIDRYKSDGYLNALFDGAFAKDFGNDLRKGIDNCYQTYPINKSQAQEHMWFSIRYARNEVIENIKTRSSKERTDIELYKNNKTRLIKATAGLGKTHNVIEEIAPFLFLKRPYRLSIEVYVPSLKLAKEVNDKLSAATSELPSGESFLVDDSYSNVIVGRTRTKNGIDVCKRKAEVEEATSLGKSVSKEICGEHLDDKDNNKCSYFKECIYQEQFSSWRNPENLQSAHILSHDYLFLPRKKDIPLPELVIIDEAFYSKGIREIEIEEPYSLIAEYHFSIVMQALDEFIKTLKPLLWLFKQHNVSANDIRKLALNFKRRDETDTYKYLAFDFVLENIADEYEQYPKRKESRLLKVSRKEVRKEKKLSLVFRKRKGHDGSKVAAFDDYRGAELNPGPQVQTDKDIEEFIRANAARNAIVNQFTDRNWFRGSLLKNKNLRNQTLRFIDLVSKEGGKVVVVMDGQARDAFGFEKKLETDTGDAISRYYYKQTIPVIHYGGFRGSNDYESYDTIILIGRNEPSIENMENQASALWFDDEEDITTIDEDANGNKNYVKTDVAYRMANGSIKSIKTSRHPDRRVDKLLRLARDSESTQAIDRLRLVHADKPKTVWLLCNIPLDITVNNLLNWDDFNKIIEMVSTENCFVIHKDFFYFRNSSIYKCFSFSRN